MLAIIASVPASPGAITLDDAIDTALASNRDLLAASRSVDALGGQLLQAGLPPNPEVEIPVRSTTLVPGQDERSLGFTFSQEFPVTRRLRLAQDVSRADIAIARAGIRERERQLIGDVTEAVVDLLLLDREITSRNDARQVARDLEEALRRQFRAAEASEADVNQASITAQQIDREVERLEAARARGRRSLALLLGSSPEDAPEVSGDLDAILDRLWNQAESDDDPADRPDVRQAALEVDRANAEGRLARAESWADWKVAVGWESERQVFEPPIGVKRDNVFEVTLTIPLPFRNRNQGRIAEQTAIGGKAALASEALKERAVSEVATERDRAGRFLDVARSLRETALPLADRNIELLREGHAQGLVAVSQLVQAQEQRLDVQTSYLEAYREYAEALVAAATAAGSSPYLRHDLVQSHPASHPATAQENRP